MLEDTGLTSPGAGVGVLQFGRSHSKLKQLFSLVHWEDLGNANSPHHVPCKTSVCKSIFGTNLHHLFVGHSPGHHGSPSDRMRVVFRPLSASAQG